MSFKATEIVLKNEEKVLIRHAVELDAASLIALQLALCSSTENYITLPSEVDRDIARRKAYIKRLVRQSNCLLLVAEYKGEIIGKLNLDGIDKQKIRHTADFGIGILPRFQGNGIGSALIDFMLQWAQRNSELNKISLRVFSTNPNAIKLYAEQGFEIEGRLKNAIKQVDGTFADEIIMSQFV